MGYPKDFIEMLNRCKEQGYKPDFIIGGGNPDSKILFVGKEPTDNAEGYNNLRHYWENLAKGEVDNWTRHRDQEEIYFKERGKELPNYWNKTQSLWSRYQTLCDYIFPEMERNRNEIFDFEEFVFCSEMNGSPSKRTNDAPKDKIPERKEFFKDPYFNRFRVVLLACGDYIKNTSDKPEEREIDNIFHVEFDERFDFGKIWFTTHYNKPENTRLVIHTRNLCSGIPNLMLEKMGKMIRTFLDSHPE